MDLKEFLSSSKELLQLLKKDEISIADIVPITKHSIVDIERPGICVDRLDGVLHTNLIWLQTWELEDIKAVYKDMKVLKNEFGKEEIGFSNIETSEYFYEGVHTYSIALQRNEDKLMMQFITDVLKSLVQDGTITMEQFYSLSEEEIVTIIKKSKQKYL